MKKTLITLLILTALGLCGLSVAQWRREAQLREEIRILSAHLTAENKLRVEAEEKVAAGEQEIQRLTQLRADTEAKLIEVTSELTDTRTDHLQRGVSIALLSGEFVRHRARADAAEAALAEAISALANRNDGASTQNTAIETANERLKQVTAERDQAIKELNTRTRSYNELVEKYNKLVR